MRREIPGTDTVARTNGRSCCPATGLAKINGRSHRLEPHVLLLIEHGDRHEIRNTGRRALKTLNIYVPPAYTTSGEEIPGRATA